MNILLLGGTGFIGKAVTTCLIKAGAKTTILCRNPKSLATAESLGAKPLSGDISYPEPWIKRLDKYDAVIHLACTFGTDMFDIDRKLCHLLVENLGALGKGKSLIYTGGTWLYPDSAGKPISENTSYAPLKGFEWMATGANYVQQAISIRGITLHPAVVVDDPDGISHTLLDEYQRTGEIAIPENERLIWPLVDVHDLAESYKLVLENGTAGESYNAAGIEAASVFRLGELLAEREGLDIIPKIKPTQYWIDHYGETGTGYALSQILDSSKLKKLGWQPRLNRLR